MEKKVGKLCCR